MALQNIDNRPAVSVGTTAVRLYEPGALLDRVKLEPNYVMFRVPADAAGSISFAFIQRYTDDTASVPSTPSDEFVKSHIRRTVPPGQDAGLSIGRNVDLWVWSSAGTVSLLPTLGVEDGK